MTLYEELGVASNATPDEIKSAHRKRVKETHPDRYPGDAEAATKFHRVQHAFKVLSDPDRRANYDRTGDDGSDAQSGPTPTDVLISAWNHVIEEFSPEDDLLSYLKETIRHGIKEFEQEANKARASRTKFERMRARLTSLNAASTLLSDVLSGRIEMLNQKEASARQQVTAMTQAIDMLNGWSYSADRKRERAPIQDEAMHAMFDVLFGHGMPRREGGW